MRACQCCHTIVVLLLCCIAVSLSSSSSRCCTGEGGGPSSSWGMHECIVVVEVCVCMYDSIVVIIISRIR